MRLLPKSPVEESGAARVFAWAAFVVACAAIAVYGGTYVLPFVAVAVAAAGHRFSYAWRRRKRPVYLQLLVAGLVFGCLAYFVADSVLAVFGGNLPQANFVMLLVAVTSFDLTTRRNLYSSLWMSLALLYLAAVFAWDFGFAAFVAAWVVCVAAFWTAAHLKRLRAVRLQVPPRPVAVALAGALVAGGALFWLLPQPAASPSGPLVISLPSQLSPRGEVENPALPLVELGSGGAGSPDNVSLRYRGRLGDDVVMYVRTGAPAYWRGLVFDTYRNGTWTTALKARAAYHPYVEARDLPPAEGPQLGSFVETFRVLRSMPGVVYAAAPVESIYYPAQRLERDAYGDWFIPGAHKPGTVYSVVSHLPDYTPAALRAPPPTDRSDRDLLDTPEYFDTTGLSARARALARRYAAGVDRRDRYDVVMAVTLGLQRDYRYSLDLGHAPAGSDPIDWFLFDAKIGYCEQFATAETLLLRSLGVPARLATGYAPGDYNPQLDQTVVRERDAHAWVEVYFPGHGWVPVDPSPGYSALAATRFPDRWAASGLARLIPHLTIGAPAAAIGSVGAIAALPGVVAAAVALLLIARLVGVRRRRNAGEEALLRLYERIQRRLGTRRRPAETPAEYRARAPSGELAPLLDDVTAAVNRGAYGQRWPTPAEVAALRARLR